MKTTLLLGLTIALFLVMQQMPSSVATLSPLMTASSVPDSDKSGYYIVVLRDDTTHETFQNIVSTVVPISADVQLHGSVEGLVKAFTVKLSDDTLHVVRSLPEVEYVEEETMAHGAQTDDVIWHVDRLDQYNLPYDNTYQPVGNGTGEGVDIYIMDSGINYDHEEFEGRALYGGFDPTDVDNSESRTGHDCNGHGTHVASLAAGKTYGAAKKARLYSIRVLDCYNRGRYSTIVSGLDYVARMIPERERPAVVSMSLSGPFSWTVESAVRRLHSQGIIIVVAAGNDRRSACTRSPASSDNVITVGGTDINDRLYRYSNLGPCVDIFAPGYSIRAASYSCDTCTTYKSGTSMATPKVSGVAAIHLENNATLTPDEMKTLLTSTATPDIINFGSSSYESTTPNKLLYIGTPVSIDCEELPDILHGSVNTTALTPGSVATYTCDAGYRLSGAPNRTCNFLGRWSGDEPTCTTSCPELSSANFSNGYIRRYNGYPDEGSYVSYRCYYRYVLVGPSSRTCQNNGTWSGDEPICVAQCPYLSSYYFRNGRILGLYGNPSRIVGTVITYVCDAGYILDGPANRTCQSNRQWSGEAPSCVQQPSPPTFVQALCSIVVWNLPASVPCDVITDYEVNLYHPQLAHQSLSRTVSSNGTFYILSNTDNSIVTSETQAKVRALRGSAEGEWSEGISLGCT